MSPSTTGGGSSSTTSSCSLCISGATGAGTTPGKELKAPLPSRCGLEAHQLTHRNCKVLVVFIIEYRNFPKAFTDGNIQTTPFALNEGEHLPGLSMDEQGLGGGGRRRECVCRGRWLTKDKSCEDRPQIEMCSLMYSLTSGTVHSLEECSS